MLHLKSSESPQIAARLPVSGGRGPEAKRVRAQAVAGIPEQSLCQFLPEMPLSSPSWNFSQWHLWQKCTHLFWGYTQLHGSKGWTLHRCQPNFLFSQKLGFWLSLIAGRWAELWWVSWLFLKLELSVNGSTTHDKGELDSIKKKIKLLLSLWAASRNPGMPHLIPHPDVASSSGRATWEA